MAYNRAGKTSQSSSPTEKMVKERSTSNILLSKMGGVHLKLVDYPVPTIRCGASEIFECNSQSSLSDWLESIFWNSKLIGE